ncbi:hypothetical protein JI664_01820 [Rhodobacter sp. NTK016B]|uniref:hypothetical protein n=1 Tax=Rhodobacter sp. NTK016B TaxID=2759676 RepID=UPI001A8C986C|nr:hypothetical protein [Rhodobacter sp. NTK016B]MBN8290691.1 hypothetical protein [Rhodobacter sp. NTK016B]
MPLPAYALIIVSLGLLLGLALLLPGLEPVRRAFLTPAPDPALAPGECVIADLRPDARVLILLGALLIAGTIGAALTEEILLGAPRDIALLTLLPFSTALAIHLACQTRCHWRLTDRRVITALGASLPLGEIGRITVGPMLVRLDGHGTQSLRLTGLADAHGAAQLIRDSLPAHAMTTPARALRQ